MKILFDYFIFDLQYAGGISNVWFNLIKGLLYKKSNNLTFVEGVKINNIFRNELLISSEKVIKEYTSSINLRKFKKVINNNCDIYHSSYFRPLKNKGDSKVVVTVHDFIYEKYSSFFAKNAHVFFKNRALRQADAVICVSENTRQDFYKYYPSVATDSVHVVYNGVDKLYQPIKASETLKINNLILKKDKFLLYVGNRGYCKNFPFILKLMNSKIVRDLNFKLVCVGGGKMTKDEENQIKFLNLQDKILLISKLSTIKLNELYNHTFLLLFPSIYEGFGIPVVEAMKAGCPIWSTNSSSVKELLGPSYPVSFNPNNWQEALISFEKLCLPKVRKSAVKVGLNQSKKFSWEKCVNETLKIYKHLLKNE